MAQQIAPDHIDVWQYHVADPIALAPHRIHLLSQHEQGLAAKVTHELHRAQLIVSRAFLREKLALLLGLGDAAEISIETTGYGKPFVRHCKYHFNVSHRSNIAKGMIALIAIIRHSPVGIDVEEINPQLPIDRLMEDQFTVNEQLAMARVPAELRHLIFAKTWTQKEAYLKCLGVGLSQSPTSIQIPILSKAEDVPVVVNNICIRSWLISNSHLASLAYPVPAEREIRFHEVKE